MNERFAQLENHNKNFEFLYDISSIQNLDPQTLELYCKNIYTKLSVQTENNHIDADIDANELQEELRDISNILPYSLKPLDVLNYLCKNYLLALYPNSAVALRILLTIPVSVASGEKSFSKLKLIKNYLRSSLSQIKLTNLSIISIESQLASSLDYSTLIDEFATLKPRRVKL